jgi:hypothetical protein
MGEQDGEWTALREYIRREMRSGFVPRGEIVENALEAFEEDDPEQLEPVARQILEEEAALFEAEWKGWPRPTDNDRLDEAFEALAAAGIVARQDWTCCQTCGHAEIWGEIEAEQERGAPVRGYTFYHQQDTESAVGGSGLYLAYGAMEEEGLVEVGEEIRRVLEGKGLRVRWNGSANARIWVEMEWHRAM